MIFLSIRVTLKELPKWKFHLNFVQLWAKSIQANELYSSYLKITKKNLICFWKLCKWYFKLWGYTATAQRWKESLILISVGATSVPANELHSSCFKDRQYRNGCKEEHPHGFWWNDHQNFRGNFSDFFDSCDIVVYEDRVCVQQFESAGNKAWKPNSADWRWPENKHRENSEEEVTNFWNCIHSKEKGKAWCYLRWVIGYTYVGYVSFFLITNIILHHSLKWYFRRLAS